MFGKYVVDGINLLTNGIFKNFSEEENKTMVKNVRYYITEEVLDQIRENVGKFPAETGGMIGSKTDVNKIDLFYFDVDSANTAGAFNYNVKAVSKVNNEWKDQGYEPTGFIHSHPIGLVTPSFRDVATSKLLMDFWHHTLFTMPIVQAKKNGLFRLYLYVAYREEKVVRVKREVVIQATKGGYEFEYDNKWERVYAIKELDRENGVVEKVDDNPVVAPVSYKVSYSDEELFGKFRLPEVVKNKVIACVGLGGARGYLNDMARFGFRNFVLIDGDVVSASNIATQQVYISEIGKKKAEVMKAEILDINPNAEVVCVSKFLDESVTDEEFIGYFDKFKVRSNKDILLLGCTDNFDAQARTSYLALKYGMMYEAASMYKNGAGAEVIFTYPGVTPSCPRCLLRSRFEKFEKGYKNDVGSADCPVFATEVMNAYKGFISLMMLMYHDAPGEKYNNLLEQIKDRNFVWIKLSPNIKDELGIGLFDRVFGSADRYTFMGETAWVPQVPDNEANGSENCKMCGGTGNLTALVDAWEDTREVAYGYKKSDSRMVRPINPLDRRMKGGLFDKVV